MTVNCIVVKQETQISALRLFLQNEGRKAPHLETFLEDLGVPVYDGIYLSKQKLVSFYAAKRLLQRAKQIGVISLIKGRWVNGPNADAFLKGTTA